MGRVVDQIEEVARDVFAEARKLTGNSLGIPGLDPGIITGDPAPVTIAAMVVGGAELGTGALAGSEGVDTVGAVTTSGTGGVDAINSGAQMVTKGLAIPEAVEGGAALDAMTQGGIAAGAAAGGATVGANTAADAVSSAPGTADATNAAFGDGLGSTVAKTADEGTVSNILNWAKNNQKLAASMITGAGLTLGGAAKGALDYASAENKAKLDRETLLEVQRQKPALYQQFVQASSSGGGGVTLPFGAAAAKKPITTSTGQPIFGQGGIIGSRLGG